MTSDEQLANEAQQGSDDAFSQLVSRYRDKLLRFLLTRCASRADAEDAIQDTFVNAYRYLHSFDSRWRFSTWLYRIAIRNAMRRRPVAVDADLEAVDERDPLQQCIEHSERENLWLVARRLLAPDVFTAMWLHYAEDVSMKDVSRILERSNSWTKVSILRARRKLAKELQRMADVETPSTSYG